MNIGSGDGIDLWDKTGSGQAFVSDKLSISCRSALDSIHSGGSGVGLDIVFAEDLKKYRRFYNGKAFTDGENYCSGKLTACAYFGKKQRPPAGNLAGGLFLRCQISST